LPKPISTLGSPTMRWREAHLRSTMSCRCPWPLTKKRRQAQLKLLFDFDSDLMGLMFGSVLQRSRLRFRRRAAGRHSWAHGSQWFRGSIRR
jgi:hypothetical protein